MWLWALCPCCCFPWCQGVVSCFYLVALRAVGCRVCCLVSAAPVRVGCFFVVAGCLGPCSCAPVLVLLVRARGPALRLGVCLLGFPAVVCTVTPIPPLSSLCNINKKLAYKRSSAMRVPRNHVVGMSWWTTSAPVCTCFESHAGIDTTAAVPFCCLFATANLSA